MKTTTQRNGKAGSAPVTLLRRFFHSIGKGWQGVIIGNPETGADERGADSVQRMVRPLCQTHPDVNYKTAWGCPECVRELRAENANLRDALERIVKLAANE
jgi:hypothetical protein